jgi:hypothetical protein
MVANAYATVRCEDHPDERGEVAYLDLPIRTEVKERAIIDAARFADSDRSRSLALAVQEGEGAI